MVLNDSTYRQEKAALDKLRAAVPRFVTTMIVRERSGEPRPTHIHLGGDFTRKGERVAPGVPAVLPRLDDPSPGTPPDRLDLANWLVDRRNPLTARVVVNRIWQVYFGRGLVETDNDFGTQGSPPSHPELLDWLACELMDRGWSQKAIHRLIVCSATYRQSSKLRPGPGGRSRQSIAVAAGSSPSRRRADPRRRPDGQWSALPRRGWPERLSAPARWRDEPGSDEASVAGRYRPQPLSPGALYVFLAGDAQSVSHHV